MGFLLSQSRTSRRWVLTMAAVLLCVILIHTWILRQTWEQDFEVATPETSTLVNGTILMQRLSQAVTETPPPPSASNAPKPARPSLPDETLNPITLEETLTDPSNEEINTALDAQSVEPQLGIDPPASSPQTEPVVKTDHLQDVSSLWRYQVTAESKGRNFFANATLQWKLDQDTYNAHAVVSALLLGQRSQTSEGTMTSLGLTPSQFTDISRRNRRIQFDWQKRQAFHKDAVIANGMPDGTQDRLSVIVQLTVQLMNAPVQPKLYQEWEMPVMGFSGLESWTFVYLGQALQDLPAGKFITWHLQRKPQPDDKRGVTVDLWLAPAQYFVPVRIRYTEPNGDFVDQKLVEL